MKSLDFLEQVDHNRKAAIYAAAHDGKMRNFAYHEGLGECRETFSRLLQAVQEGEIGVILTPDAACLAIETSPGCMEAFIQVVKQHEVLIGDHSHDLVYDLREEGGWCPVPPERRDWLSRAQQQEDAMAAQSAAAMKPHRASLPKGAHLRVILPGSGEARDNKGRKRGGRNT